MKINNDDNTEVLVLAQNRSSAILQFIRFIIVGVCNTLVTLFVIFICKSLLEINPYLSNAIGYIAGVLNSFIWNRTWVFKASDGKISKQALRFILGFVICYSIQFLIVWLLNQSGFGKIEIDILSFTLSGYGIATIIGNVAYTLCNFTYNRLFAFR